MRRVSSELNALNCYLPVGLTQRPSLLHIRSEAEPPPAATTMPGSVHHTESVHCSSLPVPVLARQVPTQVLEPGW